MHTNTEEAAVSFDLPRSAGMVEESSSRSAAVAEMGLSSPKGMISPSAVKRNSGCDALLQVSVAEGGAGTHSALEGRSFYGTTCCCGGKECCGGRFADPASNLWPVIALLMSFAFPPAGCVMFCVSLGFPTESTRYRWAVRAMFLGAALSFAYALFIACMFGSARYEVYHD